MFRKFSSSFAIWALALICVASFSLMFSASRGDSAIDDELAHIPAGYGYVHDLSYRLNPEHPPLVKALAALPVLLLNPTFPTNDPAWTTEVNGEWDMGTAFLYGTDATGQPINSANAIIQTARIMPILLTLLTVLLIYFLARRLMGSWWALLPAFMFAFDPTVLAHGHYVTTDVGAAFGVVLATFFFLKFIEAPTTKHLWWAGLAFGVAQITKFSAPLITVLFIFVTLVLWLREIILQRRATGRSFRRFWQLLLIIVIGYVFIVYPVYTLFTVNYPIAKQVSDTTTILASFANGPTPAGRLCSGLRCLANADIWMSKNFITRPYAEYLLGLLMVLQRTGAGNTIYFLGNVVNSGGWIYFPALFLLKEPIPTLLIIFLALGLAAWWIIKKARTNKTFHNNLHASLDYIGTHFAEFSMAAFIVLYWAIAMHSSLNLGLRYVLPTFPFIYILAAGVWKQWVTRIDVGQFGGTAAGGQMGLLGGTMDLNDMMSSMQSVAHSLFRSTLKYIFLIIPLAWLFLETVFAAPYFLSYFNEFGGGVWGGYHYATDSNYDWGQDLLRLQTFVNAHPEIDKIAVDYFGGGNPQYYLGAKEVNWSSSKGNPADPATDSGSAAGSDQTPIHWLAVSINTLQGATQPLVPGETRNASDTYAWLTALRPPAKGMGNVPPPDYRIGTSIFVYKL